jgi:acetyl-CoA synthetase
MVPEAAIAMLACSRIGAVHSVVFGGFSAQSVADRIFDSQAKLVITADGGFRRGAIVQLKRNVDEALTLKDDRGNSLAKTVEKVILRRFQRYSHRGRARRLVASSWNVGADCPPETDMKRRSASSMRGSTGKPKGISTPQGGICSAQN